jgi:thiamine-monophosphate kinase
VTLGELGERGLIERLRVRLGAPGPGVLLGIGDDAALVRCSQGDLLLTTDTLVEDVHFRRPSTTLRTLGAKALAVNLSDIAAMGGEPCFALVALALAASSAVADVDALYEGLADMAGRYGVALVGGDTCASPGPLVVTVALLGRVEGPPVRRAGARPGDLILVTGTLGAAAAGLAVLERGGGSASSGALETVVAAHHLPTPRVPEGRLAQTSRRVTAMIDLSDGLATDLGHLTRESGVGAEVRLADVPIASATREVAVALDVDPWVWAVAGGEDYELLLTSPPDDATTLATRIRNETGTRVAIVGEIRPPAEGLRFLDAAGRAVTVPAGFDHFA